MSQDRKKIVLVADHNSPKLISLAEQMNSDISELTVLTASSAGGALELAKKYQPEVAVVISSLVRTGGQENLLDLIKEVSPKTRIVVVEDRHTT